MSVVYSRLFGAFETKALIHAKIFTLLLFELLMWFLLIVECFRKREGEIVFCLLFCFLEPLGYTYDSDRELVRRHVTDV